MNKKSTRKTRVRCLLGTLVLGSVPLVLFATSYTDITINHTGEVGIGANFVTSPSVSIGTYNAPGDHSLTVGNSLTSDTNALVVGRWNTAVADAFFVVGTGSVSGDKNALEVHSDGTVLINAVQGDIPVGIFGD